jgi:hypothetical protein
VFLTADYADWRRFFGVRQPQVAGRVSRVNLSHCDHPVVAMISVKTDDLVIFWAAPEGLFFLFVMWHIYALLFYFLGGFYGKKA